MKTSKKLTALLLAFGSFATIQASENICPAITGHQLSTVCLSTQVERVGVDAGEIVVGGVRLLNNKNNCSTLTSVAATIKQGKTPIPGTFIAMHGEKKSGGMGTANVEIKGKCVYKLPKLLGGSQQVEFDVTTTQKLIEGKRINPMATHTPPQIGEVKVDNPPEHEKKPPILGIFKKKDPTSHSPVDHSDQHAATAEHGASGAQQPVVTHHMPKPQVIEDYKGGDRNIGTPQNVQHLPNPPEIEKALRGRPKPLTAEEVKKLDEMRKQVPEESPPQPSQYQHSSQPPSRKPPLPPVEKVSPQRPPQLPPRPVRPEPVTVPEKHEEAEASTDFRSELEKRLARQKALADAQSH
jgi:hypothetical protein